MAIAHDKALAKDGKVHTATLTRDVERLLGRSDASLVKDAEKAFAQVGYRRC